MAEDTATVDGSSHHHVSTPRMITSIAIAIAIAIAGQGSGKV